VKQAFKAKRFRADALERIEVCNAIIEKYQEQDLRLSLRQLYYVLVSSNVITNEEKSYKNLGSLVSDARMAGLIDWGAIEDRVRQPRVPSDFASIKELVNVALLSYRLPRWEGQENYAELWVEKDALAGVLRPLASRWHVTLMVNRGYSSTSAMYESAMRFIRNCYEEYDGDDAAIEDDEFKEDEDEDEDEDAGRSDDAYNDALSAPRRLLTVRQPILLYLGDHDPSGEDMVRDVGERLKLMGVKDLEVRKLALTMAQVEQYKPPPNPTKKSDSRAAKYMRKFGTSSWEVDALPPEVLQDLIEKAIRGLVDVDKMDVIKDRETRDKEKLRRAANRMAAE